ncbi:MAG: AtpZ/AtpI family protein [Actinomycetota bacterium]
MPRAVDRLRAESRRAADATWNLMAELLAAIGVWGGIGYGLDRLLHTGPWLLAIGLLIGHGMGIYIAIWRGEQMRKARQNGGVA